MLRGPKPVRYLNFACSSASVFWLDVCVPSHSAFFARPSRLTAIQAAWPTWHVHEWLWHENHPGKNVDLKFRNKLITDCPQLGWLRDVTDASKHCGLGRTDITVDRVSGTGLKTTGEISDPLGSRLHTQSDPLQLIVDGGSHNFDDVLRAAIRYLQTHYFQ
jgi:hypothetical protein